MQTIVNDGLPRNIGYPANKKLLTRMINGAVSDEDIGLFFLYISGVQLDHYDPLINADESYPVLIADRQAPPLCSNVVLQLTDREAPKGKLTGTARAEAQLAGAEGERTETQLARFAPRRSEELKLPPVSLVVLPVKVRFRELARAGLLTQARSLKNWLACPPEMRANQRALVLTFHESSGTIQAKFAEDWNDSSRARIYS